MKKYMYKLLTIIMTLCFIALDSVSAINIIENYQTVDKGGVTSTDDDVVVSKIIEEIGSENYFDITLNVSTPLNVEKIMKDRDLSIVIVMDVSNTMVTTNIDGTMHNLYPNKDTRYKAAMKAGEKFINTFFEYSEGVSAKREIGYVAFNSDATKIFDLEDCKTQNSALNLINKMKSETNNIVYGDGYSSSKKRFTNIEAGLKMARDMLDESNSENKYVIFLSDGFPTTYVKNDYIGYDNYTPSATSSTLGNFYDSNRNLPCSYGASYSDRAAERAQTEASKIKDSGVIVFSVGAGLDGQLPINELIKKDNDSFSVVDSYKISDNRKNYGYDYVIGNSITDFKNWLKNNIGSGYYYDVSDTDKLVNAYKQIFKRIENISQTKIEASWVVNDAMNEFQDGYIEFIGFYDKSNELNLKLNGVYGENEENTASFTNDKINWDLKNSGYTVIETDSNKIYNYELKYRIRLRNEKDDFDKNNIYNTNGDTFLTYRVNEDNILSEEKTVYFKVPKVIGYLTNLSFLKISNINNKPLSGVEFKLVHDKSMCNDSTNVDIEDMSAISDENGIVTFKNIPSGHDYILKEVSTLDNYIIDETEYKVNVSYGKISITPELSINENNQFYIKNKVRCGSLVISKIVKEDNEEKDFKFVLWLDNQEINGQYGDLIFENGVSEFTLKNNETVSINGIPIGTKYTIEELDNDEYLVTSTNSSGIIKENETIESVFTNQKKPNNKNEIEPPNTGDQVFKNVLLMIGSMSAITVVLIFTYCKRKKKYQ